MYSDNITLFCQYKDKERKTWWYPTVLTGVNINMDKASILARYGPQSADNAVLNVRYRMDEDGNKVVGDKIWLPPKDWGRQEEDRLFQTLTFADGERFGFFWVGEWTDTGVVADTDYAKDEGFYGYMNRMHDFVFRITAVSGPFKLIPHFEIMGR